MGAADLWSLEASGCAGEVVVEVLAGAGGRILSLETPSWSLDFQLPDGGLAELAAFVRAYAGRAEFAECVAGSFFGQPVVLVKDDEFADRFWLRVCGNGQLAEFPLVGEVSGWFAAAIAEVAGGVEQGAEPGAAADGGGK
jgi:hypothetical protein